VKAVGETIRTRFQALQALFLIRSRDEADSYRALLLSITFIDGQCRKVFSWQHGSNSICRNDANDKYFDDVKRCTSGLRTSETRPDEIENTDYVARCWVAFLGIHDSKGRFGIARIKFHETERLVLGVAYEPGANPNFTCV
jgi:hypothetical protein